MKKVGKLKFEAICPLCRTIYLLDYSEIHYMIQDNKERAYINCSICERGIFIDTDDKKMFRYVYLYKHHEH